MNRIEAILLVIALSSIAYAQNEEDKSFFLKLMDMRKVRSPPALKDISRISTSFYNQTLDHFDVENDETWDQRYFVNDEFFTDKENAPIFLLIGGEATASVFWMKYGAWYGYAEKVGALMVQLEHRFYGESHPTENMSVDNLKYLTSQQALEDIVQFIGFIKEKYNVPHNKWVTFGGSYPGSLSLWMRSLYPELIAGALSSSAPVEAKVDFEEYLGVVNDDMNIRDSNCSIAVVEGIKEAEFVLAQGPDGWKEISKVFGLCKGWSGDYYQDVRSFFLSIVGAFYSASQYDSNLSHGNVANLCSLMKNEYFGKTNMERLANTLKSVYSGFCVNVNYNDLVDFMKKEDWAQGEDVGYRQWVFQTCNEFGWYQTGNLWGSFLPVNYFIEQCMDIYGAEFTRDVILSNAKKSNEFYGAKNPTLSNTIITHGSFDPWHPMGILKDMNESVKAFVINGTSHCFDLYPPNPLSDPEELTHVRHTTFESIKKWIE